ncbi:MAG: PHB depolymerase family esterase [Lentisphaeria bacterium]|jgi:polyhydroxybutyrate depolymerase
MSRRFGWMTVPLLAAALSVSPVSRAGFRDRTPAPDLTRETFRFGGRERSCYRHLPPTYESAARLPVVLALHGGGKGDAAQMAAHTGFCELADREGFIAVFPNGVDGQWNDGRGRTYYKTDNTDVDDIGFISALIDRLVETHNGDPERIYVTGISNGGHMALRLGCEISSRLAAIAPVCASIPKNIYGNCTPAAPLPVLLMNGTDDPLVPWNGGSIRFFRKTMGEVVSTEQTVQFWVQHNHCDPAPVVRKLPDKDPGDGSTVRVSTYTGGNDGSEVILYAIEGGRLTRKIFGLISCPSWLRGESFSFAGHYGVPGF